MKKAIITGICVTLAGCMAAPTRVDVDEFELLNSGRIQKEKVPHFVDCLTDGFNTAHYMVTSIEVRHSTRATGNRVETYTGSQNILLVSADVFTDGQVALYESSAAALINTKGERDTFEQCLSQFRDTTKN